MPEISETLKGSFTMFYGTETKNFRRKNVIPPNMNKIFRYSHFSETLKGGPQDFSALWDQKFSTENLDTPFFLLPPPVIHKFFRYPELMKD